MNTSAASPMPCGTPISSVPQPQINEGPNTRLRDAFDDFVGQTFYGQLLASLRNTVEKPAYFHGGRAEEIFQSQLDQVLSEKLSDSAAHQFTQPMFDLFNQYRK